MTMANVAIVGEAQQKQSTQFPKYALSLLRAKKEGMYGIENGLAITWTAEEFFFFKWTVCNQKLLKNAGHVPSMKTSAAE